MGSTSLPPLWSGRRRRLLAGLVSAGCAQAGAAAVTALILGRGFAHPSTKVQVLSVGGLAAVAALLGWLRCRERVLAERLGQHYVHQVRRRLLKKALKGGRQPSLGVALARNTNDLTSVRQWLAFGVAPLAVAVPLVLGATVVLTVIHPLLGAALLLPLLMLGGTLAVLSGSAYRRSRRLRRARGRLAAHLADTLVAASTIRAAGGRARELRRLSRLSTAMVGRAVDRAVSAGRIRGAAAAAGGLALTAVVAACLASGLEATTLAAAVTVVALLGTPVQDLGRVVEYRQSYRAARHILDSYLDGPSSAQATIRAGEEDAPVAPLSQGADGLAITDLAIEPGSERLPDLRVPRGARVCLSGSSSERLSRILATIAGAGPTFGGSVLVDNVPLARTGDRQRRSMLGYVARAMPLERGTVLRAVRYRQPTCAPAEVDLALQRVGLADRVATLPGGLHTPLKHGGHPLHTAERTLLLLARATLGSPPLLLLDHIDADLGPAGQAIVGDLLSDYPGVIVAAGHDTGYLSPTHEWAVG